MIDDKRFMLDTNILVYLDTPTSSFHGAAKERFIECNRLDMTASICRTNIHEFARVAYRPMGTGVDENGLGWTRPRLIAHLQKLTELYQFLPEDSLVDDYWLQLFKDIPNLRARDMGDLQIAATMLRHNIRYILTRDPPVFSQVPGIHVLNLNDPLPEELSGAS